MPGADASSSTDPTVRAWCQELEPKGDAHLYLQEVVRASGLLAVAEVCMPKLVEVDGMVLIEARYSSESLDRWRARLGEDRAALARTVNNFGVWDELRTDGDRVDAVDDRAAEFVASCWRARAAEQFPGREVVVEVVEQYGPTVVMYESSQPSDAG